MDYRHGPIAIAAPGRRGVGLRRAAAPGWPTRSPRPGRHSSAGSATLDPMADLILAQRFAVALAAAPRSGPRRAAPPDPVGGAAVTPTWWSPLDVGGTGMKCALVDGRRPGPARRTAPDRARARPGGGGRHHPATSPRGWPARHAPTGSTPVAVGVAVPGVVDEAAGVAVWSANVGFRDVPLRDLVGERLGLPAALGHDVRAGGLAEARLGAGRGAAPRAVRRRSAPASPPRTWSTAVASAGAHGAAGRDRPHRRPPRRPAVRLRAARLPGGGGLAPRRSRRRYGARDRRPGGRRGRGRRPRPRRRRGRRRRSGARRSTRSPTAC